MNGRSFQKPGRRMNGQARSRWNAPTSRILSAGESFKVGVRFSVAKSRRRGMDDAVRTQAHQLFGDTRVHTSKRPRRTAAFLSLPPNVTVSAVTVEPAGALSVQKTTDTLYQLVPSSSFFGRARPTLRYSDSRLQTVHYHIKKSGPETIADLGRFLTTQQYFANTSDPFGRAPSVMTYDYQAKQIVTQDDRVWIAGLSDEAGAGSFSPLR